MGTIESDYEQSSNNRLPSSLVVGTGVDPVTYRFSGDTWPWSLVRLCTVAYRSVSVEKPRSGF